MESAKWYQKEVVKLLAIMNQDDTDNNSFISKEYIKEKLNRILSEIGIGIHPTLEPYVEEIVKKLR